MIIFKVVLTQLPGQELTLEVFDKDMDMNDDFMGRYEGCCQYNPWELMHCFVLASFRHMLVFF